MATGRIIRGKYPLRAEYRTNEAVVIGEDANQTKRVLALDSQGRIICQAQFMELQVIPLNLFEWTSADWVSSQALTSDGIQWSDEKALVVGQVETQVFGATFEPVHGGSLVAVQLGLTCQLKSGEATAAKTWVWKARNKDGTWVNLHPEVSENLTTSFVEKHRSGVFRAIAGFDQVPFEIGLFCTPHSSEENATMFFASRNSPLLQNIFPGASGEKLS